MQNISFEIIKVKAIKKKENFFVLQLFDNSIIILFFKVSQRRTDDVTATTDAGRDGESEPVFADQRRRPRHGGSAELQGQVHPSSDPQPLQGQRGQHLLLLEAPPQGQGQGKRVRKSLD